ncbi:hypothetical protein KM043_007335 [Ampulex compressa]|nr:hypothetical protein KM043_007335 [Ampulex compressa]
MQIRFISVKPKARIRGAAWKWREEEEEKEGGVVGATPLRKQSRQPLASPPNSPPLGSSDGSFVLDLRWTRLVQFLTEAAAKGSVRRASLSLWRADRKDLSSPERRRERRFGARVSSQLCPRVEYASAEIYAGDYGDYGDYARIESLSAHPTPMSKRVLGQAVS